jgi:hypothetical protein
VGGVGGVVGDPPGHAVQAELELGQEGEHEAGEPQPEMPAADPLRQQPAEELREPEIQAGEQAELQRGQHDDMEVGDHVIGVVDVEVDRRRGQEHPGDAADQKMASIRGRTASGSGYDAGGMHGGVSFGRPGPGRVGPP